MDYWDSCGRVHQHGRWLNCSPSLLEFYRKPALPIVRSQERKKNEKGNKTKNRSAEVE